MRKCGYYKGNIEYYLRIGTIFEVNNKKPTSVLLLILKLWLNDEYNTQQIVSKLKEIYHLDNINVKFINVFLQNNRKSIANYLRTRYQLDPLAYINANNHVCIDESLFSHNQGDQIWVCSLINVETKEIRL